MKTDRMLKKVIQVSLLCAAVLISTVTAQESSSKNFPVPEAIKDNVEFWKNIYAVYPTSKVLIHDINDLSIIYEVIDLEALGDNFPTVLNGSTLIKSKLNIIKFSRKLAARKVKAFDANPRISRVVEIYGVEAEPALLRKAANSLRGQLGLKDRFKVGLERSGLYLDFILQTFTEHNLPTELTVLPHVESSFNYKAYSKVGAAGIWQFIRSTGRRFMKISYDIDERLDPIHATDAAAKLLKLNYKELGSWPLAITAYNHGLNGMKRAKKKFGDDFSAIYRKL